MTMSRSPSRKPARRKSADRDREPAKRPEAAGPLPRFVANPRKPNRILLAFSIVLFVVWFVLLLLLALFAK